MKHDVFSPHQVTQKAFSALSTNREPSPSKHQEQQLQIPLFNPWTALFTLSVNRLSRTGYKKLYKLLKRIMDMTRSTENKFLCVEADTLTYYKNQFNFPFSGFFSPVFFFFILKMLKDQKSNRQEKEFVWDNNSSVWNKW